MADVPMFLRVVSLLPFTLYVPEFRYDFLDHLGRGLTGGRDMKTEKPDRKRTIHMHFYVDEEEKKLIYERMALLGTENLSGYLRKAAIDSYFITIDLTDVKKMVSLQGTCANNINQIAKRVNGTGNIYAEDIEDLRRGYDSIWEAVRKVLAGIAKIK
jgi:hypothetical protein